MAIRTLHHHRELEDMRNAYDSDRSFHSDHDSDRSYPPSQCSSDRSNSTQPTVYSHASSKRPPRIHHNTYDVHNPVPSQYFPEQVAQESPRASAETYASTIASEEDLQEELPAYEVPGYFPRRQSSDHAAIAATPTDFSELFPSHRRLAIRHDDATLDGNMNLRVDTEVTMHGGRRRDMTLYHLRMHDLKDREFSLRRYCRDSGREVCHSTRKQQKSSPSKRPGFQRSFSKALSRMRSKSDEQGPTVASLKRNDSGYASAHSSIDLDREDRPTIPQTLTSASPAIEPDTIKLEFSNYAQIDVKRAGAKGSKRYEFEYWGAQYTWRRVVKRDALTRDVSYHLTKAGSERPLAYIVPSPLTPTQADDERSKGGWIPPCSMWIADESIVRGQKDVADVVISTGLMALVDDSIQARFHSKASKSLLIPKLQMGVEYVGPKRLINEMFKREGSGQQSRRASFSSHVSSSGGPAASGMSATRATVRQSSHNY